VFAETKEEICRNKDRKASFKSSRRARVKVPYSNKQDKRLHGAVSSWYRDYDTPRLVLNAPETRRAAYYLLEHIYGLFPSPQ